MLLETKKILNETHATVSCDSYRPQVKKTKEVLSDKHIVIAPSQAENKKSDSVFSRMRLDISRLGRKSLCTTKKMERLQNHLDLYIVYSNKRRVS